MVGKSSSTCFTAREIKMGSPTIVKLPIGWQERSSTSGMALGR
jgi:hypothetical protein